MPANKKPRDPFLSPSNRPGAIEVARLIQELGGDTRFQLYIEQLREMREAAIQDLCNDAVVENVNKLMAGVGEVRCYNAILSMVGVAPKDLG